MNGLSKLANVTMNMLKPKLSKVYPIVPNIAKRGGIFGKSLKFLGRTYAKYILPASVIQKSLSHSGTGMATDYGRILKEMPSALQPIRPWFESMPKMAIDISTGGSL